MTRKGKRYKTPKMVPPRRKATEYCELRLSFRKWRTKQKPHLKNILDGYRCTVCKQNDSFVL